MNVFADYCGQILSRDHFILVLIICICTLFAFLWNEAVQIYNIVLNRVISPVTEFLMSNLFNKGINLNIEDYQLQSKNINLDLWYDNIVSPYCFVKTIDIIINNKVEVNLEGFL